MCVWRDEHEVKVEGACGEVKDTVRWCGGGRWREGKKTFYSLLTQSSSGMKNAWDISQEHNYLHGSED